MSAQQISARLAASSPRRGLVTGGACLALALAFASLSAQQNVQPTKFARAPMVQPPPQGEVEVLQVRGNQVSVLGQVNRPGRYPLEVAQMRLSDVLALAGGITTATGSDVVTVVGTRDGRPMRQDIDLPRVFGGSDRQSDLVLQNNDVVYVDRAPLVYIYGEVQRPGSMRIERGMTVMQALAAGGGLTQRGTEKGIRVHRHDDASGKVQVLQPSMDDPVRDGDVIYVRESLF